MTDLAALEARIDELFAIEEIKQLKARYFRTLDQKDWDAFEQVFAPDIVFDLQEAIFARDAVTGEIIKSGDVQIHEEDIKEEEWVVRGAKNVRNWEEAYLAPIATVHQGHTPEITLTSPTTARGLWHMEHILRFPGEAAADVWWLPETDRRWHELHGFGVYDETYEKLDGRWVIKTLKLTQVRNDIT